MRARPPGGAAESRLLLAIPRGWDWDVEAGATPYACALQARSAKMAPVEHVVADAGAFLRDAALQVQGAPVERSGVWAGDLCRIAGNRAGVSWAGLSAGHREEHLHYPGCDQRDTGQGHAQAARGPPLRAAFQRALSGIRAAG